MHAKALGKQGGIIAQTREGLGTSLKTVLAMDIVNKGNGYETRQSALLYVFVLFSGLDPAQNTIVVYSVLRN